ncbi:MAG: hypothetical protein JO029_00455, partial [Candidatus Eremiobacteraeota bacterium]|nr:hypothetical protein [Candidatus Eremiobacteraeota bacterium]
MTFSNPQAVTESGEHAVAQITQPYSQLCSSNIRLKGVPGQQTGSVEMGIAWRPGATPPPSPLPSIGAPIFTPLPMPSGSPVHLSDPIVVGSPEPVMTPGVYGFQDFPDEAISMLRFADKSYRLWFVGHEVGYDTNAVFALSSPDFKKFLPIPALNLPAATAVYDPTDLGSEAFDANYAGPGTVMPGSNGRDLLMIYHAENHL